MKILVTGSSGFIGQHLVRGLRERGHVVCGLDKKTPPTDDSLDFVECDLLDKGELVSAVQRFVPEVVVHLAARTSLKEVLEGDPRYAANTIGTSNLIEACALAGTVRRIVFTSTKYVHRGQRPENDRDYSPTTSYGRSKAEMEKTVWADAGKIEEWCITRPTTVWGPGMSKHYQGFLRMIENGRYFHIGKRDVRKHMIFVGNIAHQYCEIVEAPADSIHQKVFYLADYEAMTIRGWANSLQESLKAPRIPTMPLLLAKFAAAVGDVIVKFGYRKFPFTSFRLNNLTVDDVCETGSTREVCGDLPFSPKEGADITAEWYFRLKSDAENGAKSNQR